MQVLILSDLQGLICTKSVQNAGCLASVEIRALAPWGQAWKQKTPARCWRYGDSAQYYLAHTMRGK